MVGGINVSEDELDDYEDGAEDVSQAETPDGSTTGGELLEAEEVSSLTASATGGSPT